MHIYDDIYGELSDLSILFGIRIHPPIVFFELFLANQVQDNIIKDDQQLKVSIILEKILH